MLKMKYFCGLIKNGGIAEFWICVKKGIYCISNGLGYKQSWIYRKSATAGQNYK